MAGHFLCLRSHALIFALPAYRFSNVNFSALLAARVISTVRLRRFRRFRRRGDQDEQHYATVSLAARMMHTISARLAGRHAPG